MTRRDFIIKTSITFLLFSTQESFAKVETFKIPKNNKNDFLNLRKELAYKPYNGDLINKLLSFNQEIGTSAYKDKEMKSFLLFLFVNTKSKKLMDKLKNAIENPLIQTESEINKINELKKAGKSLGKLKLLDKKKELTKYKKKYLPYSYESLSYLRFSGQTEKELKYKEKIEENDRLFNPGREKEIYYKMLYYINSGDISEAEYTLSTIEKKIKKIALNKKTRKPTKISRRHSRAKKRKKEAFSMKEIYLAYIAGLGAFIYKDTNKEKFKEFASFSKTLLKDNNFYFYQMYSNYLVYEDYDKAIEYLLYIKNKDSYKELNEELFTVYVNSANKNLKEKNYKNSWLSAKEGIIIGMDLDYKEYYKKVISLKKILKRSGLEFIKQLIKTNNRELAQATLEETNRILRLTK